MHSSAKLASLGNALMARRTHTHSLANSPHARGVRLNRYHQGRAPRLPTSLPPSRQMDLRSAKALLLCCKQPLGKSGKLMLNLYIDDSRDFARRVECEPACLPRLSPADRCCEHDDNGRCQGRVSPIAIAQLCAKHQTRSWGDRWLADCQHIDALPEHRVMTPEGWFMRLRLRRMLNWD